VKGAIKPGRVAGEEKWPREVGHEQNIILANDRGNVFPLFLIGSGKLMNELNQCP
jgi:hypothetical protein